jgi:hypothetical protein
VKRKDQTNKKKLSPLTNHSNTKKGAIKGGLTGQTCSVKGSKDLTSYSITAVL